MHVLILLIGGNPLPNYVVAKYLLEQNRPEEKTLPVPDKLILVYSEKTRRFITPIIQELPDCQKEQVDLESNERTPHIIVQRMKDTLDKLAKESDTSIESVHLNYTGGTKAMSVHSYIAVKGWIEQQRNDIEFILSDLNPKKRNKIVLSKPDSDEEYPLGRDDLRTRVEIDVKKLLPLHNMQVNDDDLGIDQIVVPEEELDAFVEDAILKYKKNTFMLTDCSFQWLHEDNVPDEVLKKLQALKDQEFSSRKTFLKAVKNYIEEELLKTYQEKIVNYADERKIFRIFDNIVLNKKTKQEKEAVIKNEKLALFEADCVRFEQFSPSLFGYFRNSGHLKYPYLSFINFVKHEWLEHFVFKSLHALKDELTLNDIRIDVEATYDGRPTQIDVIAIRGYQLCLISCTTDQGIKTVKEKAFEAIYRAEQLGGEHAKAIVVSLMVNKPEKEKGDNNLEELEKDLKQFDAERNCFLIGLGELEGELNGDKTLTKTLKNIIRGETEWKLI